jgi:zinc transport system permease protein
LLLAYLDNEFMQRALLAGILVGLACPLIGIFLLLRRQSFIGEALSHVALAGVALGVVLGINPTLTGLFVAVFGAFGIEQLRKSYADYAEVAIALIMAGGIGLAVIFISIGTGNTANIMVYLFGSIVAITNTDLVLMAAVTVVVLAATVYYFHELFYATFSETNARLSGVPVSFVNVVFTLLVAMTTAISIRIVGSLLVSGLMVIPSAIALQLARSFSGAVIISVVAAQFAVILGLALSVVWDLAPGGTIILTSLLLLGVSLVGKRFFTGRA